LLCAKANSNALLLTLLPLFSFRFDRLTVIALTLCPAITLLVNPYYRPEPGCKLVFYLVFEPLLAFISNLFGVSVDSSNTNENVPPENEYWVF